MQTYQFAHWLKGFMAGAGDSLSPEQAQEIGRYLAQVEPDPAEPEELRAKHWLEKRLTAIDSAPDEPRRLLLLQRLHRDLSGDFARAEPANDD